MTDEMKQDVIEAVMLEIRGLLSEHIETIDKSMQSMYADHEGKSAFKYPVNLKIVIEPQDRTAKVTAKIGYGIRLKDESVGTIVDPNQVKMDFVKDDN